MDLLHPRLTVHLTFHLTVHLAVHLTVRLTVHLTVHLAVHNFHLQRKRRKKEKRRREREAEGDGELVDGERKKKKKKQRDDDGDDDLGERSRRKKARKERKEKRRARRSGGGGASCGGADGGPVLSDDEEGVENDADRAFIDNADADSDDARWRGGDSDDEGNAMPLEAEEAMEDRGPASRGGRGSSRKSSGPSAASERHIIPGLPEDLKAAFTAALAGRRKKSAAVEAEEKQAQELARGFLGLMEQAAEFDEEQNRAKKPAFKKLAMLGEVVEALAKKHLRDALLADGLLGSMKRWLDALPDGSLPNVRIRSELLRALQVLQLDLGDENRKDQMKRSGLGKAVMFLSRCPDELVANRRIAADLVQTWSRQLGVGGTAVGRAGADAARSAQVREESFATEAAREAKMRAWRERKREEVAQALAPTGVRPGEEGVRARARPPQVQARDFAVLPQSRIEGGAAAGGGGRTEFQRQMMKTIQKQKTTRK